MLRRMQTIDTDDLVNGSFEACGQYRPGHDAAPVCEACGWLDREHAPEPEELVAQVRTLPRRARAGSTPRRLAS
jgi:hypothetical protein